MDNPYKALPSRAFWRSAVADAAEIGDLWRPKTSLSRNDRIATAGSCFAQHIGRGLRDRGFDWIDADPPPTPMSDAQRERFNYGLFSFRTGNIYTAASLRQWLEWAFGKRREPEGVVEQGGRYFDLFRPAIEPLGYEQRDDVYYSRLTTFRAIRLAVTTADLFIFTLGLTEAWTDAAEGHIFSACPGTLVGTFDPAVHQFVNQAYSEVFADLEAAFSMMREVNPRIRFLLTVSPVPLTATASGEHVLVATTYSKSVLRAVAGAMVADHADVDYFPSYELVVGSPFGGRFFDSNLRTVSAQGVRHVMDQFFAPTGGLRGATLIPARQSDEEVAAELVCEEMLLDRWHES